MDSIRPIQTTGLGTGVRTALTPGNGSGRAVTQTQRSISPTLKPTGYGLPCVKCRKYYSAALSECPVCKSTERVSPIATLPCAPVEPKPAGKELDDQKERFL